jgi:dihydrofolate synthase/folylpolyglutamate synthase
MQRLAALAGHPEGQLRFVHVAGTNGKGSTCAMLESLLREAGLRVGLYTSPHLVSFAERIQIDRQLIPEADVARLVDGLVPFLESFPPEAPPTFFEAVTLLALRWFAEQRCDVVVWETGLGGRLDATNIVNPLASVITNIGWDHQQWLGNTLDRIAGEKAGIIKPGVPVVTAATPGRGLEVVAETARRQQSPLTVVAEADVAGLPGGALCPLGLAGPHQRLNAAVAVAALRTVAGPLGIRVDDSRVARALAAVRWPGRMQIVRRAEGGTVLLDGAHNPDGVAALVAALRETFPGTRPALVLGVLADKEWGRMVQALAPVAGRVVAVPVQSQRTLAPAALRYACMVACPSTPCAVASGAGAALELLRGEPLVLVAGSLYLIGEALEALGSHALPGGGERGLNEWGGAAPGAGQPGKGLD